MMEKVVNRSEQQFPSVAQLTKGSILVTIAHALSLANGTDFSHELSWDGPNYSRQDSQGTRGTITFAGSSLVGVFRDDHSERAPWRSRGNYRLDDFFTGIDEQLLALARTGALQYVFDEYNEEVGPIITAAFWSKGEYVTAAEPWEAVVMDGAHLLRLELMEPEAAITEMREDYPLTGKQVAVLRALFQRRIATPGEPIVATELEQSAFRFDDPEAVRESREVLAAIGIVI